MLLEYQEKLLIASYTLGTIAFIALNKRYYKIFDRYLKLFVSHWEAPRPICRQDKVIEGHLLVARH